MWAVITAVFGIAAIAASATGLFELAVTRCRRSGVAIGLCIGLVLPTAIVAALGWTTLVVEWFGYA